jgi:hypothetical protein
MRITVLPKPRFAKNKRRKSHDSSDFLKNNQTEVSKTKLKFNVRLEFR